MRTARSKCAGVNPSSVSSCTHVHKTHTHHTHDAVYVCAAWHTRTVTCARTHVPCAHSDVMMRDIGIHVSTGLAVVGRGRAPWPRAGGHCATSPSVRALAVLFRVRALCLIRSDGLCTCIGLGNTCTGQGQGYNCKCSVGMLHAWPYCRLCSQKHIPTSLSRGYSTSVQRQLHAGRETTSGMSFILAAPVLGRHLELL